jgi:probable F420-dependent oxidoreductase
VKVRLGIGLGALRAEDDFDEVLATMEAHGVDSLWLSEVLTAPLLDPVVAMSYALARTRRVKVGTGVMVLPGRHPVHVAKQLASLTRLAPRRVLPVFGLQAARPHERALFPLEGGRAAVFEEALVVVRRLLTEPRVTHHGEFFTVDDIGVGFLPSKPLDLWLGGTAEPALRRIGRLADGWLASFVTPKEAADGIAVIKAAAADAGRELEDDHYGVSIPVAFGEVPDQLLAFARERRPERDPRPLVPVGWDAAARLVRQFVDVGVTKFVLRPATPPPSWPKWVHDFADHALPLQT